ncbi:hypothetical protein EBU71_21385, partial [bacterium]|nr:hypothetical protein [Candidatus Elulimicrobium humile]
MIRPNIQEKWSGDPTPLISTKQIFGRGIRHCSHIGLPVEKRNVTIYQHVNMHTGNNETIDVRVYRIADKKQNQISEVTDLLKSNSIDCLLNRSAVYYDKKQIGKKIDMITSQQKTIDGYEIGDQQSKLTECSHVTDIDKASIDNSTFNIAFLGDDIDIYVAYIKPMYQKKNRFSYKDILKYLTSVRENIDEDILKYALHTMLIEKRQLVDENGNKGYLIYRGNLYIFQNAMKQNLRETLENRRDANSIISRRRLDLKHYVSKQAVDSVEDKDIIQKLTRDIEALANIITDKDYYRVVVDFYVDRLVRDEIFKITQYIISRKKVSTIEKYI